EYQRVVLLGPAHRVALRGVALPSVACFSTPLGDVPLDIDCIAKLARLPGVQLRDDAHAQEHSLEVQLPFLQSVLPHFRLVPAVVGLATPEQIDA
ncbi:AmmeMemoRadiSam system protein B, partial [Acinetobacter baumannii]